MTWLLTAGARRYDLLNLDANEMPIDEIAHHLSHINRFTGACSRPYSVAEHSLLCVEIVERDWNFQACEQLGRQYAILQHVLLHDAHEAYLNDISQPMKEALRAVARLEGRKVSDWDVIEREHADLVIQRFDLPDDPDAQAVVRRADLIALAAERQQLMPTHDERWPVLDGIVVPDWIDLRRHGWLPSDWARAFVDKFEELALSRAYTATDSHQAGMP